MTTQDFIDANKSGTFKKGDKVVMHTCAEASIKEYKNRVWICQTDSYKRNGEDLVFLEGFSGCFAAEYLKNSPAKDDAI